jgi:hypothetical protein
MLQNVSTSLCCPIALSFVAVSLSQVVVRVVDVLHVHVVVVFCLWQRRVTIFHFEESEQKPLAAYLGR